MSVYSVSHQFERRVAEVRDDHQLKSLLEDTAREIGFAHFAIVEAVSFNKEQPGLISLDNYPESWAEEFVGKSLFLDDPVLAAVQRTQKGFRWTDASRMLPINSRHMAVMEKSARYGMGQGFTVPGNVPGEPTGSCSFAVKHGRDLPEDNLRCADLIGMDACHAARRLRGLPRLGQVPHLSRRQLECVRRLIVGMNDKEIARSLEISPETVKRYVSTARQAYGVATRAELVACALRDGQVSFSGASFEG